MEREKEIEREGEREGWRVYSGNPVLCGFLSFLLCYAIVSFLDHIH